MKNRIKFIRRNWKTTYGEGINYINEMRLPYFNPALISLYAYGESSLSAEPEPVVLHKSYYCLEYTLEGEYIILQGENKYHLKKGDLFLGRPNCSYERKFPRKGGVKKLEINLNNSPIISLLCNHVGIPGYEVIYHCPPIIEEYFKAVGELVKHPMEGEDFTRQLSRIIFSLFTELKIHSSKKNIFNSFDFLLGNLDLFSPGLTVKKMARHFEVGERTLYRLFQKHLKCTPVQFLIHARMKYAGELLSSHTLNIREIAEECGYKNVSFFCGEFKKYTGKTPLAFRKSHTEHEVSSLQNISGWSSC